MEFSLVLQLSVKNKKINVILKILCKKSNFLYIYTVHTCRSSTVQICCTPLYNLLIFFRQPVVVIQLLLLFDLFLFSNLV